MFHKIWVTRLVSIMVMHLYHAAVFKGYVILILIVWFSFCRRYNCKVMCRFLLLINMLYSYSPFNTFYLYFSWWKTLLFISYSLVLLLITIFVSRKVLDKILRSSFYENDVTFWLWEKFAPVLISALSPLLSVGKLRIGETVFTPISLLTKLRLVDLSKASI